MKMKTKKEINFEIPIKVVCQAMFNPRPWKYEASMIVFGKRRFLTYGDTIGDTKKTATRRMRGLLLRSPMPD